MGVLETEIKGTGAVMAEILSVQEQNDLSEATSLAEHGNGGLLRDMLEKEDSFEKHSKIINEMLNLNQSHLHALELQEKAGIKPTDQVNRLKLEQVKRNENGQLIIERTLSSGGRPVFREIYNSTNKTYIDRGSCPTPGGIIPHFVPRSK